MNRQDFLKLLTTGITGIALLPEELLALDTTLKGSDFGKDFIWGVATAAFQNEGAYNEDGKGASIWDTFSHRKGKIKDGSNADVSCNFYHRYPQDIELLNQLHLNAFRFSAAWSRILPEGKGSVNQKGIDFYHRVIEKCLKQNITPWITCYHWDLPQALENKGGWTNRDILGWFSDYTELLAKEYGDTVKNWMVLNEPLAFTAVGYMWGIHAPGKHGFKNFYPAIHHAAMAQAEGGRILRNLVPGGNIGTTFSCSPVDPKNEDLKHTKAAIRLDALFNRLFVEPAAGLGYPVNALPALQRLEKHIKEGDETKLAFNFDFIGIQNYFRVVARSLKAIPMLHAYQVPPNKRNVPVTSMNTEIYPFGMYRMLKQFAEYGFKDLYVTENGAPGEDVVINGKVNDEHRIHYLREYLTNLLKAKKEGVNVKGYFVWTFMDNFEWAEGYKPRMGLVHVDFTTGKRTIKESGYWLANLINS